MEDEWGKLGEMIKAWRCAVEEKDHKFAHYLAREIVRLAKKLFGEEKAE